jgi:hypothetical protein
METIREMSNMSDYGLVVLWYSAVLGVLSPYIAPCQPKNPLFKTPNNNNHLV